MTGATCRCAEPRHRSARYGVWPWVGGRIGDEDVDLPGRLEQREVRVRLGEVGDDRAVPGARERGRKRVELVLLSRAQGM